MVFFLNLISSTEIKFAKMNIIQTEEISFTLGFTMKVLQNWKMIVAMRLNFTRKKKSGWSYKLHGTTKCCALWLGYMPKQENEMENKESERVRN